ncbi:hypothetical protein GCM10010464_40870 [Pseudonocardia yunnanensis]
MPSVGFALALPSGVHRDNPGVYAMAANGCCRHTRLYGRILGDRESAPTSARSEQGEPENFDVPGNVRTPVYVGGKQGSIERVLSRFRTPELKEYGVNEGSRDAALPRAV